MADRTQAPTRKAASGTTKKTAKRPTATKAAAKKSAAKKSAAKKSTANKSVADSPAGKASRASTRTAPRASAQPDQRPQADPPEAPKGLRAAVRGAQQLVELTGKDFEGIVGVTKGDHGWTVQVEVLEMQRIPNTTDVLAVYEVSVDDDGDLVGYTRTDRYVRGSAGEERS